MEDSASSPSDAVPRPSPNSYTQPETVFYSITYALPGQITYCIPRISEDANYQQRLQRLLEAQTVFSYQEIDATTGSLVVTYDSGLISSTEIREQLASLFQRANLTDDTEVTSVPSTAEPVTVTSASESVTDTPVTEEASESIIDTPAIEPASESIIDTPATEPTSESITDTPATEPASESSIDDTATEPASESITDTPATEPTSESIIDTTATEPASESVTDTPAIEPTSESIIDTPATAPAIKVEYSVVHSIPGRVRFLVPQIATDPAYAQRLQALLQSDQIVTSERINREAASVIITYKPGKVPKPKDELQSIFAVAVAYFSSLIQSAGITPNKPSSK